MFIQRSLVIGFFYVAYWNKYRINLNVNALTESIGGNAYLIHLQKYENRLLLILIIIFNIYKLNAINLSLFDNLNLSTTYEMRFDS